MLKGGLPELVEDEDGMPALSFALTSSSCWSEDHWKAVGRCMKSEIDAARNWILSKEVEPKGFPGVYAVAIDDLSQTCDSDECLVE